MIDHSTALLPLAQITKKRKLTSPSSFWRMKNCPKHSCILIEKTITHDHKAKVQPIGFPETFNVRDFIFICMLIKSTNP